MTQDDLLALIERSVAKDNKSLGLTGNSLIEIPEEISKLTSLEHLYLSFNRIEKLSDSITNLTSLIWLDLSYNQIEQIPEVIFRLEKLFCLNLSDNQISEIPDDIAKLTNLTTLFLSNNQIREIPDDIAKLTSLKTLFLYKNQIREISEGITKLQNLKTLKLSNNKINKIPENLVKLCNLTELDLSNNKIQEIPEALVQLINLTYLDLTGNQLTQIPQDILNSKDAQRIFSYLRNQNWISEARQSLLSDEIINTKAIFTLDDLSRILDPLSYHRDRYTALIDLMKKFEFCFAIDCDPPQFLIPAILPKDEPQDTGLQGDTLEFQYHYHVLPDSIISRFIVLASDYIHNHTYWRSGVMLEDKENGEVLNIARIRVEPEDKKIFIAISGREKTRRSFLKTIRDIFKKIHKSFANSEVSEWVPVPNHPDLKALDYQELLILEDMGESTVPIPQLRKKIDLQQLLDGYESKEERQKQVYIDKQVNYYQYGQGDNFAGDEVEGNKIG